MKKLISSEKNFMRKVYEAMELENLRYRELEKLIWYFDDGFCAGVGCLFIVERPAFIRCFRYRSLRRGH